MKSISTTHAAVLESYHRCETSGGFFDTFYDLFLAKLPEIPPRFANTDMQKQKQVVMASVLMVLRLRTGDPSACRFVIELGQSHNRRGHNIPPRLYPLWLGRISLRHSDSNSGVISGSCFCTASQSASLADDIPPTNLEAAMRMN
jgi:hypothetical protein